MSRISIKLMLAFMSCSGILREPQSCCSVIRWPSPSARRGTYAAGNLGSMESNVMAGRALFGYLHLLDGQRRCAIFLVHEKITQGRASPLSIEPIGGLLLSR